MADFEKDGYVARRSTSIPNRQLIVIANTHLKMQQMHGELIVIRDVLQDAPL
jgi:hypothetical protein